MAALTGNSVASSYQGLIKFDDNGTVQPTTLKALSDGTGGSLPISLSQVETKFTSGTIVDFTGVTVNGLPAGGGVADGVGTNSMVTTLTNLPASATGGSSIAFGRNAKATADSSISIGNYAAYTAGSGSKAIAIGSENIANGSQSIVMGWLTEGRASKSIAMGTNAKSRAEKCITIGAGAIVDDSIRVNTVVLGADAKAAQYSTALGWSSYAVGEATISIGDSNASGNYAIAIGENAEALNTEAVAIGRDASTAASQAVAIGSNVTAGLANTVSVNRLEVQDSVDSITMYSPDGTEWKVTVTNAGALLVTNA